MKNWTKYLILACFVVVLGVLIKDSRPEVPVDWNTYTDNRSGLKIKYPPYLESFVESKQLNLSLRSKQEIRDEYEQFAILSNLNSQQGCVLSSAYKDQVKKDFILFTGGIGNKVDIRGLKTNDGRCLLRIIEADGFDVFLQNYYYKVGFIEGDDIVQMTATIFPFRGFEGVEKLWEGFGFDFTSDSCDSSCLGKQGVYYENFTLDDPVVKEVTSVYDQMVSTISVP